MKRGLLITVAVLGGLVTGYVAGSVLGYGVPTLLGASVTDAAEFEAVVRRVGAVTGAVWLGRKVARRRR